MILPPVVIMSVSLAVFEQSADMSVDTFTALIQSIAQLATPPDLPQTLLEARARYIWLASVVLNIVVPVGAGLLCTLIVYSAYARAGRTIALGLGVVLCLASGGMLLQSIAVKGVLYRSVFAFTYLTLDAAHRFSPEFLLYVQSLITIINTLAVVVPVVAILAASSTLAPPQGERPTDLPYLVAQMRTLKEVLYTGSAILVTGILHMGSWLRWPAALVGDAATQHAIMGVSLAVTLFWGTTFSLVLIASYAPPAAILARRARAQWAMGPSAQQIEHADVWLRERGFFVGLSDELPQIAVILAPLLAGPLGALVTASIDASK